MRDRCKNPNNPAHHHYGGRGITVCREWDESYYAFKEWAEANGYSDDLELDRINNDGPYSPDNCRWVSHKANTRNTRRSNYLTAFGERKTLAEWVEDPRCVVGRSALDGRLQNDWEPEAALTTPASPGPTGRRPNLHITAFGETKPLVQWLQDPRCSVHRNTVIQRLKYGWDGERAIVTRATRDTRKNA